MRNGDNISQLFECELHVRVLHTWIVNKYKNNLNYVSHVRCDLELIYFVAILTWFVLVLCHTIENDYFLMIICSFALSLMFFRPTSNNNKKQRATKQQNNDYRFVDVISGKLTLLMSINLRHGILLSALFVIRFYFTSFLVLFWCDV